MIFCLQYQLVSTLHVKILRNVQGSAQMMHFFETYFKTAPHARILAWRIPWTEEPAGYSPWGHKESDTTEQLTHIHLQAFCIPEESVCSHFISTSICFYLFKILLMWTIFKVFIEFCYNIASAVYVSVFWPRGMWAISFLTRDLTHTPCTGRQSLNH